MKKKFYIILFSLFVISLIKGCGGFPKYDATREKKLNKTLEITDIKREGLTSINKTMQAAPAIEYKNEKNQEELILDLLAMQQQAFFILIFQLRLILGTQNFHKA